MYVVSQERIKYHALMENFIRLVKPKSTVYDIGKSNYHDYRDQFKDMKFKVIDMYTDKSPDIVLDIESLNKKNVKDYIPLADAILCNGVVEQCNDPMQMIRSCNAMLTNGGLILFGMVLLGYPAHECDRFRFTSSGAELAVRRSCFEILSIDKLQRDQVESYIYIMARKTKDV